MSRKKILWNSGRSSISFYLFNVYFLIIYVFLLFLKLLLVQNVFQTGQTNGCIQENQLTKNHVFNFKSKAKHICYWQHVFQHTGNVLIYKSKYMETKDMISKKTDTIKLLILALFFPQKKETLTGSYWWQEKLPAGQRC